MGLFISKAMVERHGGSLSIDSRLGQGTTVTINLPLERLLGGGLVQVLGYKTSPALETIKKLGVEA